MPPKPNLLNSSKLVMLETLRPGTTYLLVAGRCPLCKDKVGELKDKSSLDEFHLSGMCQICQDKFFDY